MSRTNHKERDRKRGIGKEYWKSRLHPGGEPLGKYTKKRTHKKERQEGRQEARITTEVDNGK